MKPLDYFNAKAAQEAASQQPPLASTTDVSGLVEFVGGALELVLTLLLSVL